MHASPAIPATPATPAIPRAATRGIAPLLGVAVVLSTALSAPAASNLSFETGDLTDWQSVGDADVVDSSFGVTPTDGSYQALMQTGLATNESAAGLASFLRIDVATLNGVTTGGDVAGGAAIAQQFALGAGDTLSFDWHFLSMEFPNTQPHNDFAFALLTDTADNSIIDLVMLADTTDLDWATSPTAYWFEVPGGYKPAELAAAPLPGLYQLSFGVVDLEDPILASALLIDNVSVATSIVPVPTAIWGGLGLLACLATVRGVRRSLARQETA